MSKRETTNTPEEAVAAEQAAAAAQEETQNHNPGEIKLVVCAYESTEAKLQALWERALDDSDFPFKVKTVAENTDIRDILAEVIADNEVSDYFILVPANTFPTTTINPAELELPVVYVNKDGSRDYNHKLPMQFAKGEIVAALADSPETMDVQKFLEECQKKYGSRAVEVGFSFGNYVTPVLRGNPCEHIVLEAFIRKKFVTTSLAGWKGIEHLVDKLH